MLVESFFFYIWLFIPSLYNELINNCTLVFLVINILARNWYSIVIYRNQFLTANKLREIGFPTKPWEMFRDIRLFIPRDKCYDEKGGFPLVSLRREGATIKALGKRWPGPRAEWAKALRLAAISKRPSWRRRVHLTTGRSREKSSKESNHILSLIARDIFLSSAMHPGHPVWLRWKKLSCSKKGLLSRVKNEQRSELMVLKINENPK